MGKTMAVCIAGMHRSGTSMVARLLRICGLNLGSEKDFLPAAADNPEGFWEHRTFLRLNEKLLAHLGGPWWQVHAPRPGWENDPGLEELRRQARELVDSFRIAPPWGWKDPRNSLTLPFWKQMVPQLQVIICLRNPLEAALSLRRRHGMALSQGLRLWLAHYEHLLAAVPPGSRTVTHYLSYFHDPKPELRRLLDAIGLTAPEAVLDRACATIAPDLRHGKITTPMLELAYQQSDVISARITGALPATYASLAAEAGPVFQAAEALEAAPCDPRTLVLCLRHEIQRTECERPCVAVQPLGQKGYASRSRPGLVARLVRCYSSLRRRLGFLT
jgi:hypothetical protein